MELRAWLAVILPAASAQLVGEPTRPHDLWNPLGATTTTSRPRGSLQGDEVMIRLPIGDLIGRKVVLKNLPWTPNQDPLEQIPPDRDHLEPNPVGPNNTVTVFTFLGVPYAEPPTGERRFKPPQQLLHFPGHDNAYAAFTYGPTCAQDVENRPMVTLNNPYPFLVSEDCLYLNIYSPEANTRSGINYPVIIFFHGGNFQTGSANDWPAHGLASRGLVVVNVNYRLGAFGYLGLGDTTTGNFGFLDQRLAMQWVRDHISSFGGDPQAVTIAGHDAGGASVGLHMLSPLSKNLFRAAASMSGAEVSYQSLIGKPVLAYNNTIKLGRYLGCTQALPQNVWDCLLTRSTDDIIRATEKIPVEYSRYLFMPTIDGENIPFNPVWQLNNIPTGGAFYPSPVPYLIGLNQQDGTEVILENRYLGQFEQFVNVDHEYMKSFAIEYSFRHNYTMNKEAIAEAILTRYTYWPDKANVWMIREKFIELTTDTYYVAPISQSAHLHSQAGSRTFMYVNNYNFSRDNDALRFIPSWMAVCHECDLYLLFNYAHMPPELRPQQLRNATFTQTDKNASQLFSTLFRRFVYYQNPNLLYDGSWAAYEPRGHWYMNFNYTQNDVLNEDAVPGKIERDYRYEAVAFWIEYIPQLVNYMTTTFPPIEVVVRRELMTFQWITAILILVLIVVIVLMGTFAYQLFDGTRYEEKEMHRLIEIRQDLQSDASLDYSSRRSGREFIDSRVSNI